MLGVAPPVAVDHAPQRVLGEAPPPTGAWYTSFILQQRSAVDVALSELPVVRAAPAPRLSGVPLPAARDPLSAAPQPAPLFLEQSERASHSHCVWVFVGQNVDEHEPLSCTTPPLAGRPEHVDEVSNAGTWHVQLSGTKARHAPKGPLPLRLRRHSEMPGQMLGHRTAGLVGWHCMST